MVCKDGSQCGGLTANSQYRLDYEKNRLCDANITFNELDMNGKVLPQSKGALTNPSGNGQNFTWSFGEVFAESFGLDAFRNKYGVVQGFKTGPDCPYLEDGLTFLQWEEIDGNVTEFKLTALGITFFGKDDFLPEYTDEELDATYEAKAVQDLLFREQDGQIADLEAQLAQNAEAEKEALLAEALAGYDGPVDEATLALLQANAEAEAERTKQDQLAEAERAILDLNAEAERVKLQESAEAEKQAILDQTELEKEQILKEAEAEKQRLIEEAQAEIAKMYEDAVKNTASNETMEEPQEPEEPETTTQEEETKPEEELNFEDFNQTAPFNATEYEQELIDEINADAEAERQRLRESAEAES